ncbi:hypothetical protein MRS44_010552 [Fusarium solani]|uniref:uncharacterized protein n=1 Tax=Fusarium solani TaxID=169388 RepID=UPI0032C44C08|nr:hypothetical protein MRS44_010552 [Fusarium solani]
MSSPTPSPNTIPSKSQRKGDDKPSMLSPFVYDTSPLPDRLVIRAMSVTTSTASTASTASTTATAATKTATKGKLSDDNLAKDLEETQEMAAKL